MSHNRAALHEMANWRLPEPLKPLEIKSVLPVYKELTRAEIEELSEPQMLALLSLSRTTRAVAIWQEMRKQYSAPPFTRSTFLELREHKFVEQPEGEKYHRLTVQGFRAADLAADIVQTRYNIHAAYLLGRVRATVTLKCTCGWGCGLRAGSHIQASAMRAHTTHLKTTKAVDQLATALAPRHLVDEAKG